MIDARKPGQVGKAWFEKYKGKFDGGWDAYRERVFARQRQLTTRNPAMLGWDSIPASQRPFQTRLMKIFAGMVEHVDVQAGKLIDELERQDIRDNTVVIYIFGDLPASRCRWDREGAACSAQLQGLDDFRPRQVLEVLRPVGQALVAVLDDDQALLVDAAEVRRADVQAVGFRCAINA